MLGVLAASSLHPLTDPLAGLAVSVWVFRNAAVILVENLGYLTIRAVELELLEQIYAAGVDRVIADYVEPLCGPSYTLRWVAASLLTTPTG